MHELVKTMVNRLCLKTRKWTFRPLITGGHVLPARRMLVGMIKCAFYYVFMSCHTNAKQFTSCNREWSTAWPIKITIRFSSYHTSSYCREMYVLCQRFSQNESENGQRNVLAFTEIIMRYHKWGHQSGPQVCSHMNLCRCVYYLDIYNKWSYYWNALWKKICVLMHYT